ncbi:NUDIX domain-containing protein, partial [Candidatus Woesearchaeota archaeon]|nr:NUDIX domain-containing protein [Candidatus Woesearchaeota archaeon]
HSPGHWDFPKGHVEHGETNETTALREIKEETGIKDAKILPDFKEKIHYFFKQDKQLISKDVVFFIAITQTKEIKLSEEHIGYEWLNYEQAFQRLTFKNSKNILTKAHQHLTQKKVTKIDEKP